MDYERVVANDASWIGEGQRLAVEPLGRFLERHARVALAFSGGCDSAFLLAAAVEAGCEVKAYMVRTAFQPSFEFEDACAVTSRLGVSLEVLDVDILQEEAICANPPDRCYLCKQVIFSTIWEAARRDGFDVLIDGTNASDDPARRPGFRTLAELGVASPLRRAGMSKADVREASRALEARLGFEEGLLMARKPSFPCLAVYVGEDRRITADALSEVARSRGLH